MYVLSDSFKTAYSTANYKETESTVMDVDAQAEFECAEISCHVWLT
jgi:hypothetical protein